MKYVYPAIVYSDDGQIGVAVPDLPGCFAYGASYAEALLMAKDAVEMWLWDAEKKGEAIPPRSESLDVKEGEIITLVAADTDEYRQAHDVKSVKKTLTIPSWLNHQAEKANAPFSQILQQGLKEYLHIREDKGGQEMEYVYPAIFHANEDGSFTITIPDLPGCISEGKSLANAIYMAQSALKQWIEYLVDKNMEIPAASSFEDVEAGDGEFVNFIRVELKDG